MGHAEVEREKGEEMSDIEKPHKGSIKSWSRYPWDGGLGYVIRGLSVDHPQFAGDYIRTSYVVKHDEATGEVETRNSRYSLIGPEVVYQ